MIESSRGIFGLLFCLCVSYLQPGLCRAQSAGVLPTPLTRAEASDFRETSSYADVMSFVQQVVAASPKLHLTSLGYTMEGRALPVVFVGDVEAADP